MPLTLAKDPVTKPGQLQYDVSNKNTAEPDHQEATSGGHHQILEA